MTKQLGGRREARERGRRFDTIRWGSSQTAKATALPGGLLAPGEFLKTGGHIVDVELYPPRALALALIFTPVGATWAADGGNFLVSWTLGIGLGSAQENVVLQQQLVPVGGVYSQVVTPAPFIPARRLTILGAIIGTPNQGAEYAGRFFCGAAPMFVDSSEDQEG